MQVREWTKLCDQHIRFSLYLFSEFFLELKGIILSTSRVCGLLDEHSEKLSFITNYLKHFEILKEGSNSIASNHLLICVTLCIDIYDHLYAYHKQTSSATPEVLATYNGCTELNYTKQLTHKSDHLIIKDIKNIIQN